MDAVKFLEEKNRMCKSFETCVNSYSGGCPLSHLRSIYTEKCKDSISNHPKEAVEIVEKWSAEHPQKTMLQDYIEKHPDAPLIPDYYIPMTCPSVLGYEPISYCEHMKGYISPVTHCVKCWNRPLED